MFLYRISVLFHHGPTSALRDVVCSEILSMSQNLIFGDSYVNKLRATLRQDMLLRNFFRTIDKRLREEHEFRQEQEELMERVVSRVDVPQYFRIFSANDPREIFHCAAPPRLTFGMATEKLDQRTLCLAFQLSEKLSKQPPVRCRAYLLDADVLARCAHAIRYIQNGMDYEPSCFVPGSPSYEHKDGVVMLVIPPHIHNRRVPRQDPEGPETEAPPAFEKIQFDEQRFDVDRLLSILFQDEQFRAFHVARQIATFPEISGEIDADGNANLMDLVPDSRNLVGSSELARFCVVAIAIDA